MSDKWDAILDLGKGISGVGGMFGGPFAQMAGQSSDVATAAMVSRELERQKKEQEKQEKSGKWGKWGSTLGSIAGGVLGTIALPGIGTAIGAGLGDMAGNAIGTEAAGGDTDLKQMVKGGLTSGLTSYVGGKVLGGVANAAGGAAKSAGTGLVGSAAGAAGDMAGKLAQLPTWMGTNMAQWGGGNQMMRNLLGRTGVGVGNWVQGQVARPMVGGVMDKVIPSNAPQGGYSGVSSPYLDERYALLNQWGS